jgi:glycosyltransferase involved in cell wall biosynthesis
VRTLVVVSATYHHRHDGRLWAYAPYARELAVWADLVPDLLVVAPEVATPPPADTAPIDRDNVRLHSLPATGGETVAAKVRQVLALPRLALLVARSLRQADAVHVRAPGNIALIGSVLAPLFSTRLVAKYAGQWVGYPEEPSTVRLQRALLRSPWWRGPVTVYGEWPDQPDKVVPFFTSVLDRDQVQHAAASAARRTPGPGLHVLFVGRLTAPKNADALVHAVAATRAHGHDVRASVIGDGPERQALEDLAGRLGIAEHVRFEGALPFEQVLARYEQADALALVSESEGWPKAIAEAMAYGVVCVGSDRGLVPWMLEHGRGLVVPPGDAEALADALTSLVEDPTRRAAMAQRASAWGARYSLDGLGTAVQDLLEARWRTTLGTGDRHTNVLHVTDTLHAGGAERVALNLVNELPRARFRTSLCTTRADGPLLAELRPDVQRLALRRGRRRIGDVLAARRLARFLAEHEVDVVHAHGTSLFIASAATALRPTPMVWHDHLGAAPQIRAQQLGLYRFVVRRADAVVTVNRTLAHWAVDALGVPAARVHRLPNFVMTGPPGRPAGDLPGTSRTRIVCVANLRPHKDHTNLLAAMAEVHRRHPDAHLLLAGEAPDAALAAALHEQAAAHGIADVVSFLGSRTDVAELLASCQVGVLASSSEGFPLALLEYASAGLAVVATDVGDCGEVLDQGRLGRLVPPNDAGALADAIAELLDDPEAARDLGDQLRRSVPGRYTPTDIIEALAEVYDEARGRPTPAPGAR